MLCKSAVIPQRKKTRLASKKTIFHIEKTQLTVFTKHHVHVIVYFPTRHLKTALQYMNKQHTATLLTEIKEIRNYSYFKRIGMEL